MPDARSRMMVTVSTLHPCEDKYACSFFCKEGKSYSALKNCLQGGTYIGLCEIVVQSKKYNVWTWLGRNEAFFGESTPGALSGMVLGIIVGSVIVALCTQRSETSWIYQSNALLH